MLDTQEAVGIRLKLYNSCIYYFNTSQKNVLVEVTVKKRASKLQLDWVTEATELDLRLCCFHLMPHSYSAD